jgi:uncharacterized membrane protein YkoI
MATFRNLFFLSQVILVNLLVEVVGFSNLNPIQASEINVNDGAKVIKHGSQPKKKALTKGELKSIIKKRYKTARVKDVDIELYNGQKVYDVDFIFRGKPYEAFITASGRILKVQIDPNVDDGD